MSRRLHLAAIVILAASSLAAQDEPIDRIVVVVNSYPVLASEWEQAARVECLLAGKNPTDLSDADRRQVLDRLIDQNLIQSQMGDLLAIDANGELDERIAQLRRDLYPNLSDGQWQLTLARLGLTESDVRERLAAQLAILRFIEVKFRPNVHIPRVVAENYYRDTLVPQLRAQGVDQPPDFPQVFADIERILAEQQVDQMLQAWIAGLREQANVLHLDQQPRIRP